MQLQINDNLPVYALQVRFSQSFPYLKIEFYTKAHRWQGGSIDKYLVSPQTLIGAIRNKKTEGVLNIKSYQKTWQVERNFKRIYGLQVQVFRLQDEGWVQTTGTDDLTLQQQMDLAKGMRNIKTLSYDSTQEEADSYILEMQPYKNRLTDCG